MKCVALVIVISLLSDSFGALPFFTELETLNPSQKSELEKLKKLVSPIVSHDYMKEDIYLIKWLQITEFNAQKSEEMIKDALKWREEVKVEQWDDPGFFADLEAKGEYPIFNDGVDRNGRPIDEAFFGEWDVRAISIQGKIKHLTHYSLRGVERALKRMREFQAEGKNVTQYILLINMDGFSLVKHACPSCLSLYLGFVTNYEKYYPNNVFRTFLINTPDTFEMILKLILPLMSPQSLAALKIHGTDKKEWKPILDELIDPTEISDWYDPKGRDRKAQ